LFQTKVVEKIETQIYVPKHFHESPAFYEIMWKNIVEENTTDDNMAHAH